MAKGLANCGTWFLGRLQTERDKLRVLDGLEGAATQAGAALDRAAIDKLLSSLSSRVFLMNNVHEDRPVLFQSRWTLSYLRGPLSRDEIARLTAPKKASSPVPSDGPSVDTAAPTKSLPAVGTRPVLPPNVVERFVPVRDQTPSSEVIIYHPHVYGTAKVHFAQAATIIRKLLFSGAVEHSPFRIAGKLDLIDSFDSQRRPESSPRLRLMATRATIERWRHPD